MAAPCLPLLSSAPLWLPTTASTTSGITAQSSNTTLTTSHACLYSCLAACTPAFSRLSASHQCLAIHPHPTASGFLSSHYYPTHQPWCPCSLPHSLTSGICTLAWLLMPHCSFGTTAHAHHPGCLHPTGSFFLCLLSAPCTLTWPPMFSAHYLLCQPCLAP